MLNSFAANSTLLVFIDRKKTKQEAAAVSLYPALSLSSCASPWRSPLLAATHVFALRALMRQINCRLRRRRVCTAAAKRRRHREGIRRHDTFTPELGLGERSCFWPRAPAQRWRGNANGFLLEWATHSLSLTCRSSVSFSRPPFLSVFNTARGFAH